MVETDDEVFYRTDTYGYTLPPELIATRPPVVRDSARLLVVRRAGGDLEHVRFADLGRYLKAGDCLVLNETQVVKARLYGTRHETSGRVELLLLSRKGEETWEALGRPGKRLLPGTRLRLGNGAIEGEVLEVGDRGRRLVRLTAARPIEELLIEVGRVPIPPYLGREDDARDVEDYQTVYSRVPGAVAAPTAGLHFTPELLDQLAAAGVRIARLVLHPGPATFRPVEVEDIRQHTLDSESFVLDEEAAATINATRRSGGQVVAVGTTVVRVLETQARAAGAHGASGAAGEPSSPGAVIPGAGATDLFIHPPFSFLAADALVTNFHLPRSTLLMLVCAFAGRDRLLAAYQEATDRGYLFYSYGDAMLIV
jgi:S-adenosylmethionine:tRNA ribosyltransferase-isomerase